MYRTALFAVVCGVLAMLATPLAIAQSAHYRAPRQPAVAVKHVGKPVVKARVYAHRGYPYRYRYHVHPGPYRYYRPYDYRYHYRLYRPYTGYTYRYTYPYYAPYYYHYHGPGVYFHFGF